MKTEIEFGGQTYGIPARPIWTTMELGREGSPGVADPVTVSGSPDNLIEQRADGIFVPASQDLGTFN